MRLTLLALAAAIAVCVLGVGSATADTGTLSGSFTETACGPLHPITVAPGETTIHVVGAATVAANDITVELFDPSGVQRAHADSLTSPEEVVYQSADLTPGVWNTQVCPFAGGVVAQPYTYTGTYGTSNAPVAEVVPGSGTGGSRGTPTPTYVAGKLVFSPATVVDPQRTEGEPLNFLDPKTNDYWERGPPGGPHHQHTPPHPPRPPPHTPAPPP